jgi:cytochrome c-type biogenesis protein CcmH/NrfG
VDPAGKTLHVFKGSYTQYKAYQIKLQEAQAAEEGVGLGSRTEPSKPGPKSPEKKTLSSFQRRHCRERQSEIETEVEALEAQQEELSAQLENPPEDSGEVWQLGEKYVALQEQIDSLMGEWSALEEKLGE